MNKRMIIYTVGVILIIEAFLMLFPLIYALVDNDATLIAFIKTIGITALIGLSFVLLSKPKNKTIYAKDGLIITALVWIFMSIVGALPFVFSKAIPSYIDALFEIASGFTTTGSSILSDVEVLPRSLLFWRSFSHWIGGMGVLVFAMAAIPLAGGGGNIHIMKAESPGFEASKLVPKIHSTAKILYLIYFVMTVALVLILLLEGVSFFDSLLLSFGTAGTGGFAIKNTSLSDYSTTVQATITIGMALFGINFNCYYLLLIGKVKECFKNEELRWYIGIMLGASLAIAFNILNMFDSFIEAFHASSFQVSSVMTTTGYCTENYDLWPEVSKLILLAVMCIGASAGSTGGGLKVSRIIVMFKYARNELLKAINPNSVHRIKLNDRTLDDSTVKGISAYFIVYVMIFALSLIIISFDNHSFATNVSAVIATLNNIGPGLEMVGATGNFSQFSNLSKLVLTFNMIAGRLELFPMIILLSPKTWKR